MPNTVAYMNVSDPWGGWGSANIDSMNQTFGSGNWDHIAFDITNLNQYSFIYLDASDGNSGFTTFIAAHKADLEAWVSNGGVLIINAARNYSYADTDLGFGITLKWEGELNGFASSPAHPIFDNDGLNGDDTGLSWYGTYFAHDQVSGPGLTPIISDNDGQIIFGDMAFGSGHVFFGGMTIDLAASWGSGAVNLLLNILEYANSFVSSNVAPGAPSDSDGTGNGLGIAATIAEDHVVGTAIGITANATDGDGDTLSYSFGFDINGDPILTSGAFTIDASTGIVTLSSAVDFETQSSHTLTIYATDPDGLSSQADFVVDVTNVAPDAPADADSTGDGLGKSATVAEDLAVGSLIGITANALDGDGDGSPISYNFGLDGLGDPILTLGNFAIDSSTGVVTLASVLNYETATSHLLRIYATDGTDSSFADFTVAVTNVAPSEPSDSDAAGNTLAENAPNNTYTGVTAAATDVNGGTVTYVMTGTAGGRFKVDASTGQILATGTGNLDYETAPFSDVDGRYYEVQVKASDGTDQSAATTFKIYVTNVVEHLFTPGNDGSAAAPINFNLLPDGAYDPDGAQYDALAGDDYVYLPNTASVDAGNPWDYTKTFVAGDGNDVIQGGDGNDIVSGGAGNDTLFGGLGNDRLVGSSGNDIIGGGDGADKLTGSEGKDIFIFTDSEIGTTKLGEHDTITDFQQGTDKIDLSALYDYGVVFGGLVNGKLSNTISSANKVGYYTESGKTWIQGDVTGDGIADFSIELSGSYKLKGTDLVVGTSTITSEAQWSTATGGLAYNPYHHDDYFL